MPPLLINNASTAAFSGPLEADPAAVRHELAVNYEGLYATVRAFLPALRSADDAHIVNVLSLLSLASTPPMTGYSASKAAAHSLTQALRPVLAADGIAVHGVYPAGIDTDMLAGIDAPKTPRGGGRRRPPRRPRRRRGGHLPRPQRPRDGRRLVGRPEGVRARLLRRRRLAAGLHSDHGTIPRGAAGGLSLAPLARSVRGSRWHPRPQRAAVVDFGEPQVSLQGV